MLIDKIPNEIAELMVEVCRSVCYGGGLCETHFNAGRFFETNVHFHEQMQTHKRMKAGGLLPWPSG